MSLPNGLELIAMVLEMDYEMDMDWKLINYCDYLGMVACCVLPPFPQSL